MSLRTHVNGLEGSGVTLWNTEGQVGWGESLATESGLTLTVDLHPADLDEMKALYVGHNSSFTWLTLRMGAFVSLEDGEGNEPVYGTQVVGHSGMAVSELVEDTTRSGTCKQASWLRIVRLKALPVEPFRPRYSVSPTCRVPSNKTKATSSNPTSVKLFDVPGAQRWYRRSMPLIVSRGCGVEMSFEPVVLQGAPSPC